MDCTALDQKLLSSPLASSLPSDTLAIVSGSVHASNALYLDTLSTVAIQPPFTSLILTCYEPIFTDLAARWPKFAPVERMIAAFGRVLPVVPYLADMAEFLLHSQAQASTKALFATPCPSVGSPVHEVSDDEALDMLLSLHRLLCFRRDFFLELVYPEKISALLRHKHRAIRYLSVRILCIFLKASDAAQEEMFAKYDVGSRTGEKVMGFWEGREVDYGGLMLLEGERLGKLGKELQRAKDPSGTNQTHSRVLSSGDLSPLTADLCGVLVPRLRGNGCRSIELMANYLTVIQGPPPLQSVNLVDTPTTRKNINSIAHALRSPKPVLITGHSGSGKTFLVHQIAQNLNNINTLMSIHLGEQTDAKLLVGAYTTADTPGRFEWRAGVLTTAVREGRWVLVEDIDKAPTDVLGVLLPLMERGELVIPSRGEKIIAARGFKLVATIRTAPSAKAGTAAMNILGSRLWNRVDLEMPCREELHAIVNARFPLLKGVSPSLMSVYHTVQKTYREPSFFAVSKTSLGRQISPRDLMKWCARVYSLFSSAGVVTGHEALPDGLFGEVFMEAVDCFAGSLQTKGARTQVVKLIANEMSIPAQRVDLFIGGGHVPGYNDSERTLLIGRARLKKRRKESAGLKRRKGLPRRPFATTNHAVRLLEQIGVAVKLAEPVLLVGETGTGKTTVVQQLADMMHFNLKVINLSQQTESSDLLGGFKPIEVKTLAIPLKEEFEELFESTFSLKKNKRFLDVLNKSWGKQQWDRVITLWGEAVKMADHVFTTVDTEGANKQAEAQSTRKRKLEMDRPALQARWTRFARGLSTLENQNSQVTRSFAFSFVEGSLVKAARNGDWVLLDEINLAAPDTLESIAGLLKTGGRGSILLSEKGDVERVQAHPDFRIFGCMNPATDVGKRDLPSGLRSQFTELYVVSPDQELGNLLAIIKEYLGGLVIGDDRACADIANLYLEAKEMAEEQRIVDGANQRPHFSMRTLTRTLSYVIEIAGVYGLRRSLYEGFCMSFLTLLDRTSESILLPLIEKYILGNQKNVRSLISQIPRKPDGDYVAFRHYWMHRGSQEVVEQPHYIITPFVERNMLNLVRATATKRFPVLIQGPTGSGKTSMIEYLAKRTGQKFVRINNHEHTDLQEYLGSYISDDTGQLKFQEGILVEALRKGYWIVLDELNLAPTDVLEALNRLLDDNRELLIPETQEVVRPHKDFMLFATQNPPGLYGGRKVLSRAFRNRFLELHFDDIPEGELETILRERCEIAPSYCQKIVAVYKELSLIRQSTRLFEQKNSFATLRDLFRWANRKAVGYEQLANDGYMLLAERVRKEDEKLAVKKIIEGVMRVRIDESSLYSPTSTPEYQLYTDKLKDTNGDIVWTKAMHRLYSLVAHALRNGEPVLLVGETGCGKTTVCQMLAKAFGKSLFTVNAHQNTETGDIIGAQRPIRNRPASHAQLLEDLLLVFREYSPGHELPGTNLSELLEVYASLDASIADGIPEAIKTRIQTNRARVKALFEWTDGSLVQAMKTGQFFLLDEISLADDSVLERLNSVLETQRGILLAEKGVDESLLTATAGFQFMATMNPGGDYGKKELSPALRNRFTEIWVPSMSDPDDVLQIVRAKIAPFASKYADAIVKFAQWFSNTFNFSSSSVISIRNVLAWVKFINLCPPQDVSLGLLHGAALVFIDGLGANPSAILATAAEDVDSGKQRCISKLSELSGQDFSRIYDQPVTMNISDETIQLGAFSLPRNKNVAIDVANSFNLAAPTTMVNAMRVIRAMQLRKPILLEGSPGVGKTSLISALAAASGNHLVRINLSEHSDLMDLFGSDIPVEGGQSGEFAWRDASFLQAMQQGHWVLLDEMNLASQSVLEGLNACLDHRGEAYISELDRTFTGHPDFTVFAAQNPHQQGGGRKGLPASFVNRFTVVYVDTLGLEDLQLIAGRLYPNIPENDRSRLIKFMVLLEQEISQKRGFGSLGGPWEFNLRDTLRWLGLLSSTTGLMAFQEPSDFLGIIKHRFRTSKDRSRVDQLFSQVFNSAPPNRHLYYQLSRNFLQVGHSILPRNAHGYSVSCRGIALSKRSLPHMETIMTAIEHNMPCILVGPSGVGKSSVLKLLASIAGVELDEIALNSDIDTTDIVGGFEQVDVSRKVSVFFEDLDKFLRLLSIQQLSGADTCIAAHQIYSLFDLVKAPARGFGIDSLRLLSTQLGSIEMTQKLGMFVPFIKRCNDLIAEMCEVSNARFEWVDGMLIRAVEQGKWLVLDNANLCSPSVLDRLNSLLEPNGYLIINEHSGKDGRPKVVHPNPDFRLFLTMDPHHGELSRAMRNRAVEIFFDSAAPISEVAERDDMERLELSRYSPSMESSTTLYQYMSRFAGTSTGPSVYENLVSISLDHIPRNELGFLSRWKDHIVSHSMELSPWQTESLSDIVEILLNLHPRIWNFREEFLQAISRDICLDKRFSETQPMDPSRNNRLFSLSKKQGGFNVAIWARIYECAKLISKIKIIEEGITRGATASAMASLGKMSFLERSASKKKMPASVSKGNPGLPVFDFLSTIRQSLEHWLGEGMYMELNKVSLAHISELVDLWRDIFDLSSAPGKGLDESLFHVYLELLEEWLKGSEKTLPRELIKSTEIAMRSFRVPFQLVTGFSMKLLWNDMRPSVPPSLAAWQVYHQLKEITDCFDTVTLSFNGSFDTIASLKRSLISTLTVVLTSGDNNIGELVQELSEAVTSLKCSQGLTLPEPHESVFKAAFDYLFKFTALRRAVYPEEARLENDTLTVAHFAGRPVSELLGYQNPNTKFRASYEQILRDIYRIDSSMVDGPRALLEAHIVPEILQSSRRAKKSTIGQLSQLNIDLRSFSRQFFLHIRETTDNRVLQLSLLLLLKMEKIIAVHNDSYENETYSRIIRSFGILGETLHAGVEVTLQSFSELLSRSSNDKFNKVAEEHFFCVIDSLSQLAEISSSSARCLPLLGTAWAHYALGCLKLYVPNCALDPAMKPNVQRDRYLRRKREVYSRIEAEKTFESKFTSQEDSFHLQILQEQLQCLGEEPVGSSIERPKESEMGQLQGDFSNLLKVIVESKPHIRLLQSILESSSDSKAEEKLFQKNLSHMAERLQRNYIFYKDLVDPVLGFIYSLKLGLGIAAIDTAHQSEFALSLITPVFYGEHPTGWLEGVENRSEIQMLLLYQFATRKLIEGLGKESYRAIDQILHHFFENWKVKTTQEKEKAVADASLYRYEGEEEDYDEHEFEAMFPNYDTEPGPTDIITPDHRSLASELARHYSAIYLSTDSSSCSLPSLLMRGVSAFIDTLHDSNGLSTSQVMRDSFLPAIALELNETSQWVNGSSGKLDPRTYDFYTDGNLDQAQKLANIVERCRARLRYLIEEWPENATLQDSLETCQELLNFPNDSPVAKFLPKVERLHGALNEWQGVASSQYSAAEHYDTLTQLIISWRRLELATWPRLFDIEDERGKLDADSWWFYVYESVIANPMQLSMEGENLDNHISQLLSTLISFITSAPVGQFSSRLNLLKAFEQNVLRIRDEFLGMHSMQKGLHNLITYFSQYESICKGFLMRQRKEFEKQVTEVVLLASWKDTNIIALRDSARRSHHKLYKIVKKYRQALSQPMQSIIDGGMPSEGNRTAIGAAELSELPPQPEVDIKMAKEIYERQLQRWTNRPARLSDLTSTVGLMRSTAQSGKVETISWLDDFSCSIVSTIQELQSETPGTLSESNEKQVKHLKTRKRKAFTDTLKELRHMGLKSSLSNSTLEKQATLEAVLLTAEPVETSSGGDASYYFFRVLELLPKIRKSASEPTPDLTGPEVLRSVAYIEDLFSMALKQQAFISSALKDLQHMRQIMDRYNALSNLTLEHPDLYGNDTFSYEGFANTRRKLLWLPETLKLAIELLGIQSDFSGVEFPNAKTFLEASLQNVIQTNKYLAMQTPIHGGVWEHSAKSFLDESQGALHDMNSKVGELTKEYPEIAYIMALILPLVTPEPRILEVRGLANEDQAVSLRAIDSSLQGLCDMILVTLQKLRDGRTSYPQSPQHAGWLLKYQSACASGMKALHISDIARKTAGSISLVAQLQPFDTVFSQTARALFATYHPIIQEYMRISHKEVQEAASHYRATCKATYILCKSAITLLTKGFCMPEGGADKESSETNGVEGGTGLGDGEGAEDISKDIKADEDLSELTQEREKGEGQQEIENEEDAVDIEDDLEGQLGDMPENGDDGDEIGSGGEDIDEEAGDVDDLDPTAVDEKLWDAEGGENAKDKEGGETEGNESTGEDLEAKKVNHGEERDQGGRGAEQEMQESGGEGADEGDDVRPEATEGVDPHVPEADTLDLPEDIELDGDENGEGEGEDGDPDMDALSDETEGNEPPQDEEKDKLEESFPELDAPIKDSEIGELEDFKEENEIEAEEGGGGKEDAGADLNDAAADGENLLRTQNRDHREPQETTPMESQGPEGMPDQQDSNDQTSTQQQSGKEAKVGNPPESNGEDERQVPSQKLGQSSAQDADNPRDDQHQKDDLLNEKQDSAFRKVGDALEKWHRSRRQILDAQNDTDRPQLDNMELDDPEFEHLPDENTVADTQALGPATEEQARSLDDSMAIDSGINQPQETFEDETQESEVDEPMDTQTKDTRDKDAQNLPPADESLAGAMIGESREQLSRQQPLPGEDTPFSQEYDGMEMPVEELGGSTSAELYSSRSREEARLLWQKYEESTRDLSMGLCEQLRLILEPTLATKMRGDFRTGKRLNMKRIIPYIASQYKKDKIWMRRTKPSKRQYQVMIAVDDSKSMAESDSVGLAFETVTLVAKALSQLEVGQISIVSFGETTRLIHPFDQPFTSGAGVRVFEHFGFGQLRTNTKTLVETSLEIFESARDSSSGGLWQLEIIISDGVCEGHDILRRLVRKAQEEKIMIVFVILDSARESSILEMNKVKFEPGVDGSMELKMDRYLDSFPFGFYLVVNDVRELPGVLALALRQWLAEIVDATAQ